jgi:subtilase family protein
MESRPDRALVVRGDERAMASLVTAPFVESSIPYAGAFKIEPFTGLQPFLDPKRNRRDELDIPISSWPATDVPGLLAEVRRVAHHSVDLVEDGRTLRTTVTVEELKRIAEIEDVRDIGEIPEYQLQSAAVEHPSTVQVGEGEWTSQATPYWDAGIDGGGYGNSGTGAGQGNTTTASCTTAVPPTIVAVLDNGASIDAMTLAHSTACLTAAAQVALISANSHRKIRAYQEVNDVQMGIGSTSDSSASGGFTHGNLVAGMIACNASQLGYIAPGSLNLDGIARGARLTIQDAGTAAQCPLSDIIELGNTLSPGSLATRLANAYATGARLHVMPFGIPNWDTTGPPAIARGVYSPDARDLDLGLANCLESMVFVPVGNDGFDPNTGQNVIPDMFDGESSGVSDPHLLASLPANAPLRNQISPPATAKNIISVGANGEDIGATQGTFNREETVTNYTAKGPATQASHRTAPMLTGVGDDISTGPLPYGMYTVMSNDNSNAQCPVGTQISDGNLHARGTSFGAASVAGAAALVEDYFHQGFYPTGYRVQADRVASLSGSAVKALLAASANFAEEQIGLNSSSFGLDSNDIQAATTRSSLVQLVSGGSPVVLGNNQQGFGRVVLSQVLPINTWPFTNNVGIGDTLERPATGLVVWDHLVNGEPPISISNPVAIHNFNVITSQGQLRVCLAWPDPPGDLLVNDLDLELVDPNGKVYDGNVYNPLNQTVGQWSLGRMGPPDPGDTINNLECIHLSDDPDGNPATPDGQKIVGVRTVRVKIGSGGAVPGSISSNPGVNEDANNNHCLDPGEDLDGDGLLDTGGQTYALVATGGVTVRKDSTNSSFFANFPQCFARFDKYRYTFREGARILILDPDTPASSLSGQVAVRVFDPQGNLVDTETHLSFSGAGGSFPSAPLPVRLLPGLTGTADNGILEGKGGDTLEVTNVDPTPGSRNAVARAALENASRDGGADDGCKGPMCAK